MAEKNQTKSKGVGRGGARNGAGRKPGSANQRTREIADRAAETGQTPLEVMLEVMENLREAAMKAADADRLRILGMAASVAKDAAPYMHPRLAAIEHTGRDGKDLIQTSGVLVVPAIAASDKDWEAAASGT